jgi:hypothetical protein
MSDKRAGAGSKLVTLLAGAVAAFVARKLLFFTWKQVTGKEPPEHPEDPQVALTEAIVWGVLLGAVVSTARMLATRAASARSHRSADQVDGRPV